LINGVSEITGITGIRVDFKLNLLIRLFFPPADGSAHFFCGLGSVDWGQVSHFSQNWRPDPVDTPNKLRLVQAWIEILREDLAANWELAVNGQTPFAIAPLR
jgi:hypothetical protein